MKKTIKKSKQDNRHTTKPYTHELWLQYARNYFIFTTEQLAYKYCVSKRTIYVWNYQMRKKLNHNEIKNEATKLGIKLK